MKSKIPQKNFTQLREKGARVVGQRGPKGKVGRRISMFLKNRDALAELVFMFAESP